MTSPTRRSWVFVVACSVFFCAVWSVADLNLARKVAWALILAGRVNGIWAILQYLGRDPLFMSSGGEVITGKRNEIAGLTGNPIYLAPYILFCLILSACLLVSVRSRLSRTFSGLSLAFLGFVFLLAQSMAALISLLVVVVATGYWLIRMGCLTQWKRQGTVLLLIVPAAGGLLSVLPFRQQLQTRISKLQQALGKGQWDSVLRGC